MRDTRTLHIPSAMADELQALEALHPDLSAQCLLLAACHVGLAALRDNRKAVAMASTAVRVMQVAGDGRRKPRPRKARQGPA